MPILRFLFGRPLACHPRVLNPSTSLDLAKVRKEFVDAYRGSLLDHLQKFAHWFLCIVFVVETVCAAQWIANVSHQAFKNPDESMMGIPNTWVVLLAKYAITLNIKVVDLLWTPLSTWLSKKENWRTENDLKSHMIVAWREICDRGSGTLVPGNCNPYCTLLSMSLNRFKIRVYSPRSFLVSSDFLVGRCWV